MNSAVYHHQTIHLCWQCLTVLVNTVTAGSTAPPVMSPVSLTVNEIAQKAQAWAFYFLNISENQVAMLQTHNFQCKVKLAVEYQHCWIPVVSGLWHLLVVLWSGHSLNERLSSKTTLCCNTVGNIRADLVLVNRLVSQQKSHISMLAYVLCLFLGLKGNIVMLWLECKECFTVLWPD